VGGVEYRLSPRHPILQRCFVRPAGTAASWPCIAYDVSTHGVAVTLPCRLPPGTILEIEAWDLPGAPPLRARLVHARPVGGFWFCGCELLRGLGASQLRRWLTSGAECLTGNRVD
jgi:hypothetical protein